MPKYKFVNGVMVLDDKKSASATVAPLAVVATQDDLFEATQAHAANGHNLVVPVATAVAFDQFENENRSEYLAKFKNKDIDGEKVLSDLTHLFALYEVPVGLITKLMALKDYKINIVLDDSGSMNANTDSRRSDAGYYMNTFYKAHGYDPTSEMTRWEEEEDRLHIMLDFLSYIPTNPITISFMNRPNRITLTHDGKTPEEFVIEAHAAVRAAFVNSPSGGTPTMKKMKESFTAASGLTMHYLFTDGVPNDCTTDELGKFLATRHAPALNPLTFVSCTNVDYEAEWMKEIEETGPFMAEIDDYNDERTEVMKDQGAAFPFTKGFWLICLLAGAINPNDLDAMDESRPFSKFTMDNIMGYTLTLEEYTKYWKNQPMSSKYQKDFTRFATEPRSAREMFGEPLAPSSSSASSMFSRLSMRR